VLPVALDRPALVEVDMPHVTTPNSRAVDHGELPARIGEHHLHSASVVASRAEEIVFFDYHDYSLTKKIVLSTVFLKKNKKNLDYISY
jgi:hypothetical protein